MVLVSHAPAKSSFPSCSWCFLDWDESSICISLIYLRMISTNISVLISPPWSTDRKKNPLLSFPRRELVKGACFPFLQCSEHWHYASVHQMSSQPPQMTPTDLKTPDTPSEASLSQNNPPIDPWSSPLIPSNLHWSPINLLWSGTCPSAVNQVTAWLPYDFLVLPCHQYDSLPFGFLVSYFTANSLPYQACWLICLLIPLLSNQSFSLCLLICAYPLLTDWLQSPYCSLTNPLQSLLLSPPSYLKYYASLMYIKPPEAQRSPGGTPPSIAWNYPSLSTSLSVSLYSLSLVGFSESLKASVFKSSQVYHSSSISLGSDGV